MISFSSLLRLSKKFSDFSLDDEKPLFWMLLGPISIITTLLFFRSESLCLPTITLLGVFASWKYRLNGFLITFSLFILYFSFTELSLWKLGSGLSLLLGGFITFLSMEELRSFYKLKKEEKEKIVADLKRALYQAEEENASSKRVFEREQELLENNQKELKEEITSLLNLVQTSQIEEEKSFKQNTFLSEESLENHRKIQTLQAQNKEDQEQLEKLQSACIEASEEAKKRLKELNTQRVEFHQAKLLLEGPAKKEEAPTLNTRQEKGKELALQTLEKDKGMIKRIYDQLASDFKLLNVQLEKGTQKFEKASEEERPLLSQALEKLKAKLSEKETKLKTTKSELISIEREAFTIKKGMQHQGIAAYSN